MTGDRLSQFANEKYLNLETFKKDGTPVDTPVWFAQEGDTLFVYSRADAGKVKRIRSNPGARIAPCDVRGKLRGAWVDASARIADGDEARRGQSLLTRKYGWLKRVGDFFSRLRQKKQAVIAIRPA
jgi:uncharacterized protein